MKTRLNYVSNSSSTSFLVCYNDEKAFDFLKEDVFQKNQYRTFISDIRGHYCVNDFISGYYSNRIVKLMNQKMYPLNHQDEPNAVCELFDLCVMFGAEDENLGRIINEGIEECETKGKNFSYDKLDELGRKFAEILVKGGKKKWKHFSSVRYGGHWDTDRMTGYMFDLMKKGKDRNDFLVLKRSRNE